MYKAVRFSDLFLRFDVRYHSFEKYNPDSYWRLSELKEEIVRDPNCYGFRYSEKGVPIIRISDMKQPFIDFSRVALISEEVHRKFPKTHLKPYDVLISVRGMSAGKVSIYLGEFEEANISPNIIIVRLKNTDLAPYVAMILISEVGRTQIRRFFSGGGKPSLTASMVNMLKIPIPTDDILKQVILLFSEVKLKREQGGGLLKEIEMEFSNEIDMSDFYKRSSSSKRVSQLSCRWDSHYHNEGYTKLRDYLSSWRGGSNRLEKYGMEKRLVAYDFDSKEKIEYIEIGSVNNLTGVVDSPLYDYPGLLPKSPKVSLEDGDLLISKVRPYLNANALFIKSTDARNVVASRNAFSIFNTHNYSYRYYLAAFLRSELGVRQIEMYQSGTSYPTVSDEDVKKVIVLEISKDGMDAINGYYRQYLEIKRSEDFAKSAILELLQPEDFLSEQEKVSLHA